MVLQLSPALPETAAVIVRKLDNDHDFKVRCNVIKSHVSFLRRATNASHRLRVLWCFRETRIGERRKPFDHKVSVKFMFNGFPIGHPYRLEDFPTFSHFLDHEYDVVILEDMMSCSDDVEAVRALVNFFDYQNIQSFIVSTPNRQKYINQLRHES